MITGIIDIGSNSIRLSVFRHEDGGLHPLLHKKNIAGLASFVENGRLTEQGIQKACRVTAHFAGILKDFGISSAYAFATASLRLVDNAREAAQAIREASGLAVELLSGEEEARLGFVGAAMSGNLRDGCLADIGGASTELTAFAHASPVHLSSLPMGSLSLRVGHVSGILPVKDEMKAMRAYIREQLETISWGWLSPPPVLCGVGGTFRALRELAGGTSPDIPLDFFRAFYKRLKDGCPELYAEIYRVAPERIYTLLPGCLIMHEIIRRFQPARVIVSKGGVREGYLFDRIMGDGHDTPGAAV